MTAELRRGITLAILGLLAGLVLVAGFLGDGRTTLNRLAQSWRGSPPVASAPTSGGGGRADGASATPPVEVGRQAAGAPARPGAVDAQPDAPRSDNAKTAAAKTEAGKSEATKADAGKSDPATPVASNPVVPRSDMAKAEPGKAEQGRTEPARTEAKAEPGRPETRVATAPANGKLPAPAPSFDVIRVEPSGDAVLAGRGAPGATIEMLRGGEPFARTLADSTGLFAIVPPPLPRGTSEISLRMIAPDGTRSASKDTAVIVVPQQGTAKPLIALTSPDKPTVVLSQPETAVAARPEPGSGPGPAPQAAGAKPAPQTPVKVVSVDAETGGRLFVTAQAPPGATVRLYLNDTLVAPAGAGQDGRVSFAIGRGVQAGQYRVRIDQVDPVSGEVRARSEVPFSFPSALAAAPAAPSATTMSRSPEAEALVGKRVEDLARQQEHAGPRPAAPVPALGPQAAAPPMPRAPAQPAPPMPQAAPDVAAAGPLTAASTPDAKGPPGARVYVPEVATLMVGRGDNLWSISRKSYGRGARYTVIYDANQDQIRNPALIYPGQVFVMPTGESGNHRAERR